MSDPSIKKSSKRKHDANSVSRRKRAKNGTSRLEQLPVELLQDIFLRCMNLSLPRSSPFIAQALNSEHVKMTLCIRAFMAPLNAQVWSMFSPPDKVDKRTVQLQSDILACRWMNYDFYRRYQARAKVEWPILLHARWGLKSDPPKRQMSDEDAQDWQGKYKSYLMLAVGCRIPEKVLHGPWTDERVILLKTLVANNAKIDLINTTSGEVALKGMADAVHAENGEIIEALYTAGLSPTTKVLITALEHMLQNEINDRNMTVLRAICRHPRDIDWNNAEIWVLAIHIKRLTGEEVERILKDASHSRGYVDVVSL